MKKRSGRKKSDANPGPAQAVTTAFLPFKSAFLLKASAVAAKKAAPKANKKPDDISPPEPIYEALPLICVLYGRPK
jgi:hypothetical protein